MRINMYILKYIPQRYISRKSQSIILRLQYEYVWTTYNDVKRMYVREGKFRAAIM